MNHAQPPLARQDRRATQRPEMRLSPGIQQLLLKAVRHHRAGRLTEASRIYRKILAADPEHADSLHLLGMIAFAAGGHDLAVAMIRKAIAIKIAVNDDRASYHSNLGTVLQAQGKLEEAATSYERALILQPGFAELHLNLGNVFLEQEKLEQEKLVQNQLGENQSNRDKLERAKSCYERALSLNPNLAEAHHSMGNVLQAMDENRLDEAVACYERALALKPNYARAHYNLGCALRSLGRVDDALASYRMALAIQPGCIPAGFRECLAQLLKGDFNAGWPNYERRWGSKDHHTPMRDYPQPLWTGENLPSGRVLIWGEQGVGDEIMFAGLIPDLLRDVLRTGNRCLLDCDPRLKPLFSRSFPGVEVVSPHELEQRDPTDNPESDISAHLPSGSLPGLFRKTCAAFANTKSPYLFADPVQRGRFRAVYTADNQRRLVGLAWLTTNSKTGRYRSIDLSLFSPLFARSDIRWISLQYGDHDALQAQAAEADAPILIDRAVDQLSNIDIFAAQIAAMDMVITIDNSTAHLAGALGVPVYVLLPFAPDWRWLLARRDSPWYPTMRLFRQPKRGDWQSVVRDVANAL